MATSSVRDALSFSAENHAGKGTGVTALLLWAAAKWPVMTGTSDDQEPVVDGFTTLWYLVKAVVLGEEGEREREERRRSRMMVAVMSMGIQGTVSWLGRLVGIFPR